jgi:ATP-dependent Clp protease ATP-binding subunit ClpA
MIGRKAEAVLNRAVRYAVEHEHEYFTLEHVLWSLVSERQIVDTVEACGGDIAKLQTDLDNYLSTEIPKASVNSGLSSSSSKTPNMTEEGEDGPSSNPSSEDADGERVEHPVATLSIQRLIQRALFHVQSAGKDEIQPIDLFVAMFQAKDSHALYSLAKQGIERIDVLNYVSHGIRADRSRSDRPKDSAETGDESLGSSGPDGSSFGEDDEDPRILPGSDGVGGKTGKGASRSPGTGSTGTLGDDPLSLYAMNLNERALAGKIDPLVGRANELERMIQTLCRRRKNNPLLVGEAGVGKTALAEGLALRIIEKRVPELLENAIVYALDLGALLAGAKFRGDFEQRLKKVINAVERKVDRGLMPILLIDEIHTIVGAGSVSGGALDAANLLKPVLAQGDVRCIGSTTYSEYRSTFEKDHALARRFQKIDVPEPTQEEAIQIVAGLKSRFEAHHGVIYTPEAVRASVELSSKHLTDRFLPDKAIDVIDEAGAKARLRRKAESVAQAAISSESSGAVSGKGPERGNEKGKVLELSKGTIIDAVMIEEVVAQIARIPARSVSTSQKQRLKNLERDLKLTIFGQSHAIDALVTAIRLARSGLRTGDRPVGSFLFCGPTGVGKTELSKQLSRCLGVNFLRFDMSEYSERHTISRLIGAPPGYVGFEQAGLLTDSLLKNPHSVVLLDEIEKAHFDVWNVLLQIMDHGTLTDNNGRKADFRNAIIIMTSNVGSRELERNSLGLAPVDSKSGTAASKEVERTFSPEFRNRLDAVVYFNSLDRSTVSQVVSKQLLELEAQLIAKGVEVDVTTEAREWLATRGYDRQMGARPLARLIQDTIKKPLAEEILFGKLENGGEVRIFIRKKSAEGNPKEGLKGNNEDELAFEIKAKAASNIASESIGAGSSDQRA